MRREQLQETICERVGRKHCVIVGHGSTAIYLALKLIEQQVGPGEVVLPTVSCASLAQVVRYAGFKPVFADIDRTDYTLELSAFEALINENTRAVLPIHIFGHSAPMEELTRVAAAKHVFVIEDAAQSIGGEINGRSHGSFGDFSILSFSGGKIIDADAGGALVFDDDAYVKPITQLLAQLPVLRQSERRSLMALSHRNFYHALVDLLRVNADLKVDHLFNQAMCTYRELYLHRLEDDAVLDRIEAEFSNLDCNLSGRYTRASVYHDRLLSDRLTRAESWKHSGVVWRYSVLVKDPDELLSVTRALRSNGIHASNHYWSVADLFYGQKNLPATAYISRRVLNLWVDDVANESYIRKSCEIILKRLG